ncbi:MAG TPA: TIGR00300 family protein [Candidatus Polarisedimenticolia bacterium]|nr:TIGR00300 family protein [Candidatus Polarisedimenticolia bacterium]
MSAEERFLLCRPGFYRIDYVINPWMEGNIGRTDGELARRQWETLEEALAARAALQFVEPVPGLPDMPFTANAGLVHGETFIPTRFRVPQRQPETPHLTAWFRERLYRIVELPAEATFEGEGDALFQPGEALLWGGYGVRTSLQAHRDLAELLDVEVVPLRLVDERFYHLDTCFCALPGGRVLYYPEAFDRDSVETIAGRMGARDRFEVDATDALNFACNAVVTNGSFITNFASEGLRRQLATWGYEVVVCPLSEFVLAGGAAKCLVLRLTDRTGGPAVKSSRGLPGVRDRLIEVQGHLLDSGLMNTILDCITEGGGGFDLLGFQPGLRHDQDSVARLRVVAPSAERLETILTQLIQMGARVARPDVDARLEVVTQPGVAPQDFYGTTIFPTEARIRGHWVRAQRQRMDAVLVVDGPPDAPRVTCRLLRDLRVGDRVVSGIEGVRTHPTHVRPSGSAFEFMASGVSSERRVELAVERIAWEMRRIRERGSKIAVVAGPVVIHTGGGPHLARLVRRGYVQALLGGNGFAVHDLEQSLFGTSLGVDLKRGVGVEGGHRNHLKVINLVRGHGGIAQAVRQGLIQRGIFYECVERGVPFALAGSIRDDGPLPDTQMDLLRAQEEYARLLAGAEIILMLSSMLHSIGVGNMTPAGVRLICVDISPAVVTKLADRGSVESTGIVTDVGLFLNLLATSLGADPTGDDPRGGEGSA